MPALFEIGLFLVALGLFALALSPALRGFAKGVTAREATPIYGSVLLVALFIVSIVGTAIVTTMLAHC